MKRLVAVTALASGLLLILAPRYILPACEYAGYPRMHCTDTAQAENIAGALLMAIGAAAFFSKSAKTTIAEALASLVLYGVSFLLPDIYGYCRSTRMPCNYGMVPGIRFVAVAGALNMIIAVVNGVRTSRKKGNA